MMMNKLNKNIGEDINLLNPSKCFKISFTFMSLIIIILTISLSSILIKTQLDGFKERTNTLQKLHIQLQQQNIKNDESKLLQKSNQDINKILIKNEQELQNRIKIQILSSLCIVIIFVLLTYLMAIFFSKKLQLSFNNFHNVITNKNKQLETLNNSLEQKVEQQTLLIKKNYSTDPLTGFKNRLRFFQKIKKKDTNTLIIIDIDNFKEINDSFGYRSADALLKEVSERIKLFFKLNDNIFRIGSDEFAILDNIKSNKLSTLLEQLHQFLINESFNYKNKLFINFNVTISSATIENGDLIHENADMAMSIARKQNKNTLIYQKKHNLISHFESNIKITNLLKKAIENDKVFPYFQAIVDNNTLGYYKYECLIRIKDENDVIISPNEFLSVAKKIKIYPQLTLVMLNKVFQKMTVNPLMNCSVNLSYEDIINSDISNYIYDNITQSLANRLTFELLESETIDNYEIVIQFIDKLKQRGCSFAIDDFGTGYSNFEHILKLNINYLKIDASLIKDIDIDEDTQLIVKSIIEFCNSLNIKTIAEFVKSKSVYEKVKELGIDYSQGYYFHKPSLDI